MERTDRKLILRKGGNLFLEYSIWDGEEHVYGEDELKSPPSPFKIHDLPFEFEKGVTVEDLCLYLRRDMDYWEIIIGNCIREYVENCFVPVPKDKEDDCILEKCVLEWGMECSKFKGKKSTNRPALNFGMKGMDSDGNSLNYGFGDIPVFQIKDLPIEIDDNLVVYYENLDNFIPRKEKEWSVDSFNKKNIFQRLFPTIDHYFYKMNYWLKHSKKNYGKMGVSLFDVLYGIFWELSFYGNPVDRKTFFEKIGDDIKQLKEEEKVIE